MTRRRLVALVSAIVLASLGILVFATGFFVTHTSAGRDKLRDLIEPVIAGKFPNATFYLGQISGSFIGSITLDTLAIRDKRGELFLSTGRVTVGYNWRDLVDNRIKIQHADVQHPYLHFVQHSNGEWNFKEIFAGPKNNVPSLPKDLNTRNWGDYIVVDSARTRGATFLLTLPWNPYLPVMWWFVFLIATFTPGFAFWKMATSALSQSADAPVAWNESSV